MTEMSPIEVACHTIEKELLLCSPGWRKPYIVNDLKQRKKIPAHIAEQALVKLTAEGLIKRSCGDFYSRPCH